MGINFLRFNGIVVSVVGNVPVDSEMHQSRGFTGLVFEDAYKNRVYVYVFVGVSVRVLRV